MIDFIPIHNYTYYFDITILCMIIVAVWQCHTGNALQKNIVNLNAMWGVLFTLLLIPYMGLRPISGAFGDTVNYASSFRDMQLGIKDIAWSGEWVFNFLFRWFAKNSDIHSFLLLCATIYIGSLWIATVRIFRNYYYLPFLIILGMFTFWAYGVNGIRNGMGASVFILAMSFVNKPVYMIGIALLACGLHNSVYLMCAAATLAWFIKNSYLFLIGWLGSLIISFVAGGRIQSYLATTNLLENDDRFSGYLTGSNMTGEIVQMSMVFRWDFVLYSAMAVYIGYYFIFRRNFKDEYYHWIYNTFLATNAFWLLVIHAAYSNRFAQISWFIMPIVLIYPFLKQRFWTNHERMLGYAIIIFYIFTFYYNIYRHL